MKAKLIIFEEYNPFFNMAFDYYFWKKCENLNYPPILRFYKWIPHTISIGYNQKGENLVNLDFCQKNNIPIVKRPTGGSAIFHDIEITYSFCSNTSLKKFFALPFLSYIKITTCIITGLKNIGVELKLRGEEKGKEPSFTDLPCFSLSSRHDLVYNGKKIVGSAQRRNNFSFLQHGSILIDINKDLWNNIFLKKCDFSNIGCLKEIRQDIEEKEILMVLKKGFEETLELEIVEETLNENEIKEIKRIEEKLRKEEKYE